MFKSRFFQIGVVIALIVITLFAACGSSGKISADDNSHKTATYCQGVVKAEEIQIEDTGGLATTKAWVFTPPDGCGLPRLYCIYRFFGYGAGLSCTPLD